MDQIHICVYIYYKYSFIIPCLKEPQNDECKDSKDDPLEPDFNRFINADDFDNNDDDDYPLPHYLMRLIEWEDK